MEENLKQQPTSIVKIAIYGPESTGKTTLAKQLAEHFNTIWIPEFARDYLQNKWDTSKETCQQSDLIPIAIGQTKLENEGLSKANNILFADTNLMVTKVFSDIYYGETDPILEKAAKKHKYDLFLLTDVDVPWEKDDLRDSPFHREETLRIFEENLILYNKPYLKLSGSKDKRFQKAVALISTLLETKKIELNSFDFIQLTQREIKLESVKNQIGFLTNGIQAVQLERPAKLHDGIEPLSAEEATYYANFFDEKRNHLKLKKFVPASGAASRMFKFLCEFLQEYKLGEESINAYINRKKAKNLSLFLIGLDKFPFYNEVINQLRNQYPDFNNWGYDSKHYAFIKTLLSKNEFDFANKPKGVLPFHKYSSHVATPIEEHLNEAVAYASSNQKAHLHFTVSEEHQSDFERIVENVKTKIETASETEINVYYSYQDKSTDSIALDFDNNFFREDNDSLVFRPGGHGALIQNLNNLDADIVFIKNIDNVIQNNIDVIALYKKALAGILLDKQQQIFDFLRLLDDNNINKELLDEIVNFIQSKLHFEVVDDFSKYTKESKIDYLKNYLNRPIRVCGMVKNEGEPGGGPFWVRDKKGLVFLQIVESSQVDEKDSNQMKILKNATHFNPVDLVCGIRNYRGGNFDLTEFVDHSSGFIVHKNKGGKELKAYELPGLWNGAMAKWLTVFVEVPLITFNPVKTVNDLLKIAHQPQ
jgi:nicotinamide riboside kinase